MKAKKNRTRERIKEIKRYNIIEYKKYIRTFDFFLIRIQNNVFRVRVEIPRIQLHIRYLERMGYNKAALQWEETIERYHAIIQEAQSNITEKYNDYLRGLQ